MLLQGQRNEIMGQPSRHPWVFHLPVIEVLRAENLGIYWIAEELVIAGNVALAVQYLFKYSRLHPLVFSCIGSLSIIISMILTPNELMDICQVPGRRARFLFKLQFEYFCGHDVLLFSPSLICYFCQNNLP
jgi:hypothetical protein